MTTPFDPDAPLPDLHIRHRREWEPVTGLTDDEKLYNEEDER